MTWAGRAAALGALLALAAGCGAPGPRRIGTGAEPCAHCHMSIADLRYAAELVTRKGRVFAFDDIGCLVAFARDAVEPHEVHSVWVSDYLHPDSMLDAGRAVFLRAESARTPMGSHLLAVRPGPAADSLRSALNAARLTWGEVWALPRERLGGHIGAES